MQNLFASASKHCKLCLRYPVLGYRKRLPFPTDRKTEHNPCISDGTFYRKPRAEFYRLTHLTPVTAHVVSVIDASPEITFIRHNKRANAKAQLTLEKFIFNIQFESLNYK